MGTGRESDGLAGAAPITVLPSGLISRQSAATYLGLKPGTLAQWACQGRGPAVRKYGGRAHYDYDEVRRFARGGDEVAA